MASSYRMVVFDLYGTLLDVSGMATRMSAALGKDATAMLAAWRTTQLERTWELNRLGTYEPFDQVTAWALTQVAGELDAPMHARLTSEWLTVPPHPDALESLQRLRAAGARTAILSNGTRQMIERALLAAGVTIDEVRSVDEVGVYKPDPRVYTLLDELAPRDQLLFVSSNAFDADGAKRAGRTVCFIHRGGARPTLAPDFEVHSLAEMAALVAAS